MWSPRKVVASSEHTHRTLAATAKTAFFAVVQSTLRLPQGGV
jgi:hypothetical protein